MKHILIRIRQWIFALTLRLFEHISPLIIDEPDGLNKVTSILKEKSSRKILLVTSSGTLKRGLIDHFLETLKTENIEYIPYTNVSKEPDIEMVEEGVKVYKENNCEAFVCIGGGSAIDLSKVIASRIVRSDLPVEKMKGLLHIRRKLPLFIAVPTTAGTGSEVTAAAVISGERNKTHYKYPIEDFCLIPHVAILDAKLTVSLPYKVTAMTGMDALTHALEAYTNLFASSYVQGKALEATKLILDNLETACNDPVNLQARENMLRGSMYAGVAFTNNFVGNVHALAHAIGGMYGVAHGLANAILLVPLMRYYGSSAYHSLSELADYCGITGKDEKEKAEALINRIDTLRSSLHIEEKFDCIKENDIKEMVDRAYSEAIPTYPCPLLFEKSDFEAVLRSVMTERK